MSREDSPPVEQRPGILGTLELVGRKSGKTLSTFPIDALRATIGRDYDCDIRLYLPDVSKLHAELRFDLLTASAYLHVHGHNGVIHTTEGGKTVTHTPPDVLSLRNNDTFMIRKKVFRFTYGEPQIDLAYLSPMVNKTAVASGGAGTPLKPRTTHRFSLVPEGKRFVPSPIKARQPFHRDIEASASPLKSILSNEVVIPQEYDELLEVADGDEGDKVYIEKKDEFVEDKTTSCSKQAIFNQPFMTPQPHRKQLPRNTSVAPRTRKSGRSPRGIHQDRAENFSVIPLDLGSGPLSVSCEPSITSTATLTVPTPLPLRVPPQMAYSTPRGSDSLRKALLLRSARKVWEETRSQGVEEAIEAGGVVVRRKSQSPNYRQAKKSLTPIPSPHSVEVNSESDSDSDVADEDKENVADLQWVYEDGCADDYEESDSDHESNETDDTVDIPGQSIIHFSPVSSTERNEINANDRQKYPIDYDEGSEDVEMIECQQTPYQAQESSQKLTHADRSTVHMIEKASIDNAERTHVPPPETPTPTNFSGLSLSLPSMEASSVRFDPFPSTPQSQQAKPRFKYTPGSMGKPSRLIVKPEEYLMPEHVDTISNTTPVKSRITTQEKEKQREMLATPRVLPAPPKSGFRSPVRETTTHPLTNLLSTPPHPAITASPEAESGLAAVPSTPMDDIKRRLGALRLQSVQRQAPRSSSKTHRRATLGFAPPSTPISRPLMLSAALTAAGPRRQKILPIEEVELESKQPLYISHVAATSNNPQPHFSLTETKKTHQQKMEEEKVDADILRNNKQQHPEEERVLAVMSKPLLPQTPNFSGFREMMKTPAAATTPSLSGIRDMLRPPPPVLATPSFIGMRDLFAHQPGSSTPALDGVAELYESWANNAEPVGDSIENPVLPGKGSSSLTRSKLPRSEPTRKRGKVGVDHSAEASRPSPTSRDGTIGEMAPTVRVTRARLAVSMETGSQPEMPSPSITAATASRSESTSSRRAHPSRTSTRNAHTESVGSMNDSTNKFASLPAKRNPNKNDKQPTGPAQPSTLPERGRTTRRIKSAPNRSKPVAAVVEEKSPTPIRRTRAANKENMAGEHKRILTRHASAITDHGETDSSQIRPTRNRK